MSKKKIMGRLIDLVRDERSIVVGAAVKIASFEGATNLVLTEKERAALVGSREFWEANGEKINALAQELGQLEAA